MATSRACDPWVALAAMALSTTRVRLGTTVTPLPRRRPWKLAREVVTVDHLSNGRVTLGVGLGDIGDPGFTQVGEELDTTRRARMLDEGLAVLAGLWSGNPFTHDGEFYHVRDLGYSRGRSRRRASPSGSAGTGRRGASSAGRLAGTASSAAGTTAQTKTGT